MSERSGRPWLNYVLGIACLGAVVAAVLAIGPASGSSAASRRTAKAAAGVVQSTVSGSGNLEPDSQLDLGFKTAGTVERVYVKTKAPPQPIPRRLRTSWSSTSCRRVRATACSAPARTRSGSCCCARC